MQHTGTCIFNFILRVHTYNFKSNSMHLSKALHVICCGHLYETYNYLHKPNIKTTTISLSMVILICLHNCVYKSCIYKLQTKTLPPLSLFISSLGMSNTSDILTLDGDVFDPSDERGLFSLEMLTNKITTKFQKRNTNLH